MTPSVAQCAAGRVPVTWWRLDALLAVVCHSAGRIQGPPRLAWLGVLVLSACAEPVQSGGLGVFRPHGFAGRMALVDRFKAEPQTHAPSVNAPNTPASSEQFDVKSQAGAPSVNAANTPTSSEQFDVKSQAGAPSVNAANAPTSSEQFDVKSRAGAPSG